MFSGFNDRTRANMEVALDRACKVLHGAHESHDARKQIAAAILKAAEAGEDSLKALTAAGVKAARPD